MIKRALLWQDGSAQALYYDNSFIHLSKFSDHFIFSSPDGKEIIRQMTPFATQFQNNVKQKLVQLVNFVNLHVESPYMCRKFNVLNEKVIFKAS